MVRRLEKLGEEIEKRIDKDNMLMSQTSFGHISIDSSTIHTVLIAMESP